MAHCSAARSCYKKTHTTQTPIHPFILHTKKPLQIWCYYCNVTNIACTSHIILSIERAYTTYDIRHICKHICKVNMINFWWNRTEIVVNLIKYPKMLYSLQRGTDTTTYIHTTHTRVRHILMLKLLKDNISFRFVHWTTRKCTHKHMRAGTPFCMSWTHHPHHQHHPSSAYSYTARASHAMAPRLEHRAI